MFRTLEEKPSKSLSLAAKAVMLRPVVRRVGATLKATLWRAAARSIDIAMNFIIELWRRKWILAKVNRCFNWRYVSSKYLSPVLCRLCWQKCAFVTYLRDVLSGWFFVFRSFFVSSFHGPWFSLSRVVSCQKAKLNTQYEWVSQTQNR